MHMGTLELVVLSTAQLQESIHDVRNTNTEIKNMGSYRIVNCIHNAII